MGNSCPDLKVLNLWFKLYQMTVIWKSIGIDWVDNKKLSDCLDIAGYLKGSLESYQELKTRWRPH